MHDPRRHSPAAARNRRPILDVLQRELPYNARVLELASGSGEHAVHFSAAMPNWCWQPSDSVDSSLASIAAWRAERALPNLAMPLRLDVTDAAAWPSGSFDAVVAINLLHIAPWDVTLALMERARERLVPGGVLFLYGPYRCRGSHTAPSNAAFDADLRRRNPRWGIRDLEAVEAEATRNGLELKQVTEMPANNLSVVFVREYYSGISPGIR